MSSQPAADKKFVTKEDLKAEESGWDKKDSDYGAYDVASKKKEAASKEIAEIERKMKELEEREKEARAKAAEARNEVEKTLYAKQKADQDLKATLKSREVLGERVEKSLHEFKHAAATEEATMEGLEAEMMRNLTEQAEIEDAKLAAQAKKAAEEVPAKKEDPRPLSARSAPTDADAAKRAKMQPKFDGIKKKVATYKDSAVDEVKKGSYAEAIALYKKAVDVLEIAYEDFGVFKKEIA